MSTLSKRATIYFDPGIHQALKMRAACSEQSVSELVDEAVRRLINEDREDQAAFEERTKEPDISYERFIEQLKADGTL